MALLALILTTITSNGVMINVSTHNNLTLRFEIIDPHVAGVDSVLQVADDGPARSLVNIIANARSGSVVDITVLWEFQTHSLYDAFQQRPFRLTFPDFDGERYQLLTQRLPAVVWQWEYRNPDPYDPTRVPDNGSALAMVGASLIGAWAIRRR